MSDAIEAAPAPLGGIVGVGTSHVVVIVDHSGSMRKDDVPGYTSRTAAVYDCLARDLVEPQTKLGGLGKMEVSIIEMSDDAEVARERSAADTALLSYLKGCTSRYARSHGNYLPALDAALELLKGDAAHGNQLFLIFLSDGAPSDHVDMQCAHGYSVWQHDPRGGMYKGKPRLRSCPLSGACRAAIHKSVNDECVKRIQHIGDLLGRDRVHMHAVAFGPPTEDYAVLQSMAKALPRSSFQKLGLSADCLRTAFTSLTSTLTSLRTEAAGTGPGLTLRTDIGQRAASRQALEERTILTDADGWDIYVGDNCLSKRKFDLNARSFIDAPFTESALAVDLERHYPGLVQRGIAHAAYKFAEGAERVVFQCTEVVSVDAGATGYSVGPRLVAKDTRHTEHLGCEKFHRTFCRTQGEAEELAQLFNRRLHGGPEWQIRFLPCYVFMLLDSRYPTGQGEILVEEELEGVFTKWNNNAGGVADCVRVVETAALGAIAEDDDEEGEGDSDSGEPGDGPVTTEDVPQCFSHFTYKATNGRKLVCDLQGVWNAVDGFTMTDPVIHHCSGSKKNGATDKGMTGIRNFFATHKCGPLCRRLGLEPPVL
ncbi:hypothetical protein GPECTOR_3g437 [Gonium pectorale]|uniref:Alpha-type protein kinase domain-containing protein n=1 Tax=Gonium pectorale TaxID=33097 RepID=A0A150GZZ6_GONPE|nr:hypothetical protein GPECTOR_3g437 [Gonium pectorale]|eukprot:KXZ55302.1 hypothetical protein GPECTOR_3g437 [Gonium pectorale]